MCLPRSCPSDWKCHSFWDSEWSWSLLSPLLWSLVKNRVCSRVTGRCMFTVSVLCTSCCCLGSSGMLNVLGLLYFRFQTSMLTHRAVLGYDQMPPFAQEHNTVSSQRCRRCLEGSLRSLSSPALQGLLCPGASCHSPCKGHASQNCLESPRLSVPSTSVSCFPPAFSPVCPPLWAFLSFTLFPKK